MSTLIQGTEKPSKEALEQMRQRGGKWGAYQNMDMRCSQLGHLQFLKVGPDCTYETAPDHMPDTQAGFGWRYCFVGYVNLETGDIKQTDD